MTEEELIALEVERRALLKTVAELGRGDARMEISLNALCESLEDKARELQKIIDSNT